MKYIFRHKNGKVRIVEANNTTQAHLRFASGKVKDYYHWKIESPDAFAMPCENCESDLVRFGKAVSGGIKCSIKNCEHINTGSIPANERWFKERMKREKEAENVHSVV